MRDRHGDSGRELALCLGRRRRGLRLSQLGEAVGGADYAAVSVAIKRFEPRLARDRALQCAVKVAERLLVEC